MAATAERMDPDPGLGALGADEDVGDAVEAMDRCRRKKEEIVGDVPHPRVCARDYRLEDVLGD